MRALRALRRALPHRRLGHAEIHPQDRLRGRGRRPPAAPLWRTRLNAMPARINDFVIKIANVNGTGSASANGLLMKAIFRMGIPVVGKNFFPSNIQGLPTWFEIRVSSEGYLSRSGRVDIMVAMNAQTYAKDLAEVSAGGYLLYDSTWPRDKQLARDDVTLLGVPLAELVNKEFENIRARILMKNVCYLGALAALLDIDMAVIEELLKETFADKAKLIAGNLKAIELGYHYAKEHFTCPLPLRLEPMDATAGHIMVDGNTMAGLGLRVRRRHRGRLVSHHPVHLAHGRLQGILRGVAGGPDDRQEQVTASCRRRTNSPPSASCWAPPGTARGPSRRPAAPASPS